MQRNTAKNRSGKYDKRMCAQRKHNRIAQETIEVIELSHRSQALSHN